MNFFDFKITVNSNLWFAVYKGEIVFSDIILIHFCDGFPHVEDANSLMIFIELENSK